MSQAVIDFCENLQSALLGIEKRLTEAKKAVETKSDALESQVRKQIDEAMKQLDEFKEKAGQMAADLRAELPPQSKAMSERLKDFGLEAQVAMRHAIVFLAEGAAKGAEGAAAALQEGSRRAHAAAEQARHHQAVTPANPPAAGSKPQPST
jgi:ABC-type transporter Mla subunit MlaD